MNSLEFVYLGAGICYMALGFIMCAINFVILLTVYIPTMKSLRSAAEKYIERNPHQIHYEH